MLFKSIALTAGVFPQSVAALSLHLNAPNRPPGLKNLENVWKIFGHAAIQCNNFNQN